MTKRILNGFRRSPKDERDYKIDRLVKAAVKLPDTYNDGTPLGIFDQGTSEECAGCAFAQAVHIFDYKQNGYNRRFSPSDIFANRSALDYKGEGMVPRQGLKNLQKSGICLWDDFPGFFTYEECVERYKKDEKKLNELEYPNRISSFYRLNSIADIKTAIYTIGFALVAYDVYDCMYDVDADGIVHYDANKLGTNWGGHQIIATGWNENSLTVPNSWGEEFGDEGVMYVPYEYMPTESWACTDDITEKKVAQQYS